MNLQKRICIIHRFSDLQISEQTIKEFPIFATQIYADFLLRTKGYNTIWFIYHNDVESQYIIPFSTLKKAIFIKGTFLTSTLKIGNPDLSEQDFLEKVVDFIKKGKICDWIQQSPNHAIFNQYPKSAIFCPFGTYKLDLQKYSSADELFLTLKNESRYDILKAKRDGVEIKNGASVIADSFYLIRDTLSKTNLYYPSLAELKKEIELLNGNIHIYVAYYNEQPQATTIFYSTIFCTYAIYAGSKPHAVRGANSYLYWQAISESIIRNVRYFDFVGARINPPKDSKLYRIQRFKSQFNGELQLGYLWKISISPNKYRIYRSINRLICFLKGREVKGDIIDQEIDRMKVQNNRVN
jgi:hypothetical protein